MVNYSYCIKITSAQTQINLPFPIDNVSKMKVKKIRYTTASSGNEYLLVKISGWADNIFIDKTTGMLHYYTVFMGLDTSLGSMQYAENPFTIYDIEKETPFKINSFNIEILINGQWAVDISTVNPLYVEFQLA
jgi:hypothetical protein